MTHDNKYAKSKAGEDNLATHLLPQNIGTYKSCLEPAAQLVLLPSHLQAAVSKLGRSIDILQLDFLGVPPHEKSASVGTGETLFASFTKPRLSRL